jgi:murein peptide amidase A
MTSLPLRPIPERGAHASRPRRYGVSELGAPLEVFRPAALERRPLVVAGIHGEEPETTVLLSSALRSLPPGRLRAAVVLAANPDGLARGTRGNADGIELNRNFPAGDWSERRPAHVWTRGRPQDVVLSSGSQPGSAAETRALMALVEELDPSVVVTVHAPLACVIDPTGTAVGRFLAQRCELPLRDRLDVPAPGSLESWCADRRVATVTFELPVISKNEALVRYLDAFVELLGGRAER